MTRGGGSQYALSAVSGSGAVEERMPPPRQSLVRKTSDHVFTSSENEMSNNRDSLKDMWLPCQLTDCPVVSSCEVQDPGKIQDPQPCKAPVSA